MEEEIIFVRILKTNKNYSTIEKRWNMVTMEEIVDFFVDFETIDYRESSYDKLPRLSIDTFEELKKLFRSRIAHLGCLEVVSQSGERSYYRIRYISSSKI